MKKLTLMRHAKSSWADSNQQDIDRPLNERGQHDAPMMAQRLLNKQCSPDLILCSAAIRTRQTAEDFLNVHSAKKPSIEFHDSLYLASAGTVLEFIQQAPDNIEHVMVIAHNPGLETLGRQLHPKSPGALPTCAVLHFALHNERFVIEQDTQIELMFYDFPKNAS